MHAAPPLHVAALPAESALPINQQIGGPPLTESRIFSDFVVLFVVLWYVG
jgi:hypothetical protein